MADGPPLCAEATHGSDHAMCEQSMSQKHPELPNVPLASRLGTIQNEPAFIARMKQVLLP
jgi:hypothetical protein